MKAGSMKALVRHRYGAPDVLSYEDVPIPEPGHGDVLVRVEAASLNTADLDDLTGTPPASRIGRGLLRPKSTLVGLDVAGRVEAVGDGVTMFRPGDEVWADLFGSGRGALAEFVCASERSFHPRPTGPTPEQAAATPHSGTLALLALGSRGGVGRGDRVLINGAGGCVGPFAIQIAKAAGAVVTGVDHGDRLGLVEAAGADHLVDYTQVDVTRNGIRYDRIIDIAANRNFLAFRRALAPGGAYIQVARSLAGFAGAAVVGGLLTIASTRSMGVFGWQPNRRSDMDRLGRLISEGSVEPIIDRTFRLDEGVDAMRLLAEGGARGKLVVLP